MAFAWPDKIPKEKPMPRTLGERATAMSGSKYWNNSCPYCHAVQGDYFLFNEPDGPFFSLEYSDDFTTDIKKIASFHYTYHF